MVDASQRVGFQSLTRAMWAPSPPVRKADWARARAGSPTDNGDLLSPSVAVVMLVGYAVDFIGTLLIERRDV